MNTNKEKEDSKKKFEFDIFRINDHKCIGLMAQRIRRLTTDQEIPGSNPGGIENELNYFLIFQFLSPDVVLNNLHVAQFQHNYMKLITLCF